MLDKGKDLGMPDGVLINGKGPYRYNDSLVPAGIEYETFNVHPGTKIDQTPRVSTVLSTTSSALIRKADGMASGGALEEQVPSLLCRASIVFLLGQES